MAKGTDTYNLTKSLQDGMKDRELKAIRNDNKLSKNTKYEYKLSPLYAKYMGKYVTIAHAGNFMKIPVDGTTVQLSEGHYNALMKYVRHIDRQIKIQQNQTQFMGRYESGTYKKY